jgi:RES domain-containing protein
MWLDAYRRPLIGPVCRHIPDGSPFGPLDTRFATGATDNRWNDRAQPTLYLASAHEVLAVEWARHFPRDAVAQSGSRSRLRRVFDIDVALDHVLDLRDPSLCETIGLVNTPFCFVDKELCRATARRLRDATRAQGIVAPSLGMLDRADAWILVLIIDKLPGFPDQFVTAMTMDGAFGIAD